MTDETSDEMILISSNVKIQVICQDRYQVIKRMSRYTLNAILTLEHSMLIENTEIPDTFEVHGKYIKTFLEQKSDFSVKKL